MDAVIRRNPDELLIKGSMMDGTEAQAVLHVRVAACLEIADDVRCVEQSALLQSADSAFTRIRDEDAPAEPGLMKPHPRVANAIPPLERITERCGIALVERPHHATGSNED